MKPSFLVGLTLAASASALSFPLSVQAQSTTSINELQGIQPITIEGTVESVVGNNFILEDETGQVIVDAGPRWYQEVNVSPGEEVTVVGEADRDGEFDAFSITKENGTTITIRPATEGPPPWAGGPNRRSGPPQFVR